ncbi:MAG: hypothetical protein ABIQ88_09880 [Chitinophagaceae bacterium]
MKDHKLPLTETVLLLTGFIALVAIQFIFPRPPFYDEPDYLGNIALLHQYGFSKEFLVNMVGSAGPLYTAVHYLLEPLTGLHAPYIRLVNTFFLAATIFIIYRILKEMAGLPRMYALYVMAVPFIYIAAGLALTELPAMFFFTMAVYLVIKNKSTAAFSSAVINMIVAGLCMSLAIAGRQPYLLTLAAFPVLFISKVQQRNQLFLLAVMLVFSLLLPACLFTVWKGFIPTIEAQLYTDIANAGTSYRPDFFLLCIFYFAISMFLTAPGFLQFPGKRYFLPMAICLIILTVANLSFEWIKLVPAKSIITKILASPRQVYLFSLLCGGAVIFLGLYFWVCMYRQLRHARYPKEMLFFALALLLIAISCTKITWGYSSRYAAQAIPLLVLLGSLFYRRSKFNTIRIALGAAAGLLSLISYLVA